LAAIFEEGLRLGAFVIALLNLLLELRDALAISSSLDPAAHRPAQQNQRQDRQQSNAQTQRDQNSRASS